MKGIIICPSFIFAFNFYDYIKLCCIGRFHLVLVEHKWRTDRLKNIFIISFFVLHLFFFCLTFLWLNYFIYPKLIYEKINQHKLLKTYSFFCRLQFVNARQRFGSGQRSSGLCPFLFLKFKSAPFAARNIDIEALLLLPPPWLPRPINS